MKMKTIGVVALIFGVIAVAGVFLEWIYVPFSDTSVTGWDIFDDRINDSWLDYIPLASVILGALCFVIEFCHWPVAVRILHLDFYF